jgi:hypothetical protein
MRSTPALSCGANHQRFSPNAGHLAGFGRRLLEGKGPALGAIDGVYLQEVLGR